jgi:hypothetical protein
MGAGEVFSAIVEWVTAALKHDPLLVAPTLVIAAGVVGLAAVEAVTLTLQLIATMVRHYRHRFVELGEALRELRGAFTGRSEPHSEREKTFDVTRPRIVQRERLSQQQLFDRAGSTKKSGTEST